jgi:hypothetical protein
MIRRVILLSSWAPPENTKASERIQLSTGGFSFTAFWRHEAMLSSRKVRVMLLILQELVGMNEIRI